MEIKISNGNIKMGKIPSVSLPSIVTCRQDCICSKKCYAHKNRAFTQNGKGGIST